MILRKPTATKAPPFGGKKKPAAPTSPVAGGAKAPGGKPLASNGPIKAPGNSTSTNPARAGGNQPRPAAKTKVPMVGASTSAPKKSASASSASPARKPSSSSPTRKKPSSLSSASSLTATGQSGAAGQGDPQQAGQQNAQLSGASPAQTSGPQHVHHIKVQINTNAGSASQGAGDMGMGSGAGAGTSGGAVGGAAPSPMQPTGANASNPLPGIAPGAGMPESQPTFGPGTAGASNPMLAGGLGKPGMTAPAPNGQQPQGNGQLNPNPAVSPVKKKLPRRPPKAPPPPADVANARARQTNVLQQRQKRELRGRMQGPYRDIDAGAGVYGSMLSPLL